MEKHAPPSPFAWNIPLKMGRPICYIDFPHNNNQACKVLWQDGWVGRKQYVSLRRRGNKTSHLYLNKCGHWSVHGWRKPNMVDWCGRKVDEKVFFVTIYATLKTHKKSWYHIIWFKSGFSFQTIFTWIPFTYISKSLHVYFNYIRIWTF